MLHLFNNNPKVTNMKLDKDFQDDFLNHSLNFTYSPKQPLLTGSPNESTKITPERASEILEKMKHLIADTQYDQSN